MADGQVLKRVKKFTDNSTKIYGSFEQALRRARRASFYKTGKILPKRWAIVKTESMEDGQTDKTGRQTRRADRPGGQTGKFSTKRWAVVKTGRMEDGQMGRWAGFDHNAKFTGNSTKEMGRRQSGGQTGKWAKYLKKFEQRRVRN